MDNKLSLIRKLGAVRKLQKRYPHKMKYKARHEQLRKQLQDYNRRQK